MWLLDDWYDYWRLVNIIICLLSISILGHRFWQNNKNWNTKTRDYWYSLVMSLVAFVAISAVAIIEDSYMTPIPIFILASSLITFKALLHKGTWGDHSAN